MLERAQNNPKIEFVPNKVITAFYGADLLESVDLENTITKEVENFKIDGVFLAIGHTPNTDFAKGTLSMDQAGYLLNQTHIPAESRVSKYETSSNIEGIFVAGDVEDQVYRQAITAAGNGCKAAMDAEKWLEDQER
jgi:thioredoxin reductase (NADPH)